LITPVPENTYFIQRDGFTYAGVHLLIDLWGATGLDDLEKMRATLLRCVDACGAVLRGDVDLFQFDVGGGIAGVVMLMQSHIGVHTWPESGYGAFDTFLCGSADPYRILPVLRDAFQPASVVVTECKRGLRI
jgi:S-adenosylmethionine decarboxylase